MRDLPTGGRGAALVLAVLLFYFFRPYPPFLPLTFTPAEAQVTAQGRVARAVFTQGIQDRGPIDEIETLGNDQTKIYFYTEIADLAGQNITHIWEYNGRIMAEVTLSVGSDYWRTWSSKNLDPRWVGEWTVKVVNDAGEPIDTKSFMYTEFPLP